MAKKIFTDESLATLISEIKAYTDSAVSTKSDSGHNHDDKYYTESEINAKVDTLNAAIDGKAPSSHTHTISEVTNLQTSLDGKQTTITGAATTITGSNLTASRALISNSSGKVAVSAVTSTELGYLDGVTSAIQTQLDAKATTSSLNSHINDTTKHITAAERTAWNAAEGNAKAYTDEAVAGLDGAIVLGNATISMPQAGTSYWRDITYGDGKYVAIARYNTKLIAYSTDLINWTTANLPVTKTWAAITYGNGKFVAISTNSSNVALYSTDGINWSQTTLPSSTTWTDVVYGNGKFVAVKNDGYTSGAYSEDGITWKTMSCLNSYNTDADAIGYGNGLFVIPVSTKSSYSTDGVTWNFSDVPVSGDWHSIAYGNGKFVAVSRTSNRYIYSEDGVNWTSSTLSIPATKSYYIRVAFGNGKFVAVAANSNVVSHSTDGVNWSQATSPITLPTYANDIFVSLIYADGKFILMYSPEEQTPQVVISTDGVNWSNSVEYLSDFENNNITDKVKSFVTTGLAKETYIDEAVANATATLTPVTTAGTGSAYTATISGITALTVGITITIVPHVVSASTTPTLDLNGLGAKQIRRRLSSIATAPQAGYSATWLAANQPFTLVYDGTYWVVEGMEKPVAADLYGTLAVNKGGTGATTAEAARTNLDVYSKAEVIAEIANNTFFPAIAIETYANGTFTFTDFDVAFNDLVAAYASGKQACVYGTDADGNMKHCFFISGYDATSNFLSGVFTDYIYSSRPKTHNVMIYSDGGEGAWGYTVALPQKDAVTRTLQVANWNSSLQQSIYFDDAGYISVSENATIFVAPTPDSQAAYTAAGVMCTAQSVGGVTFTCTSVPNTDLSVNIVILD